MAKVTINDIVAQFASSTEINNRFQQIEDELNNNVLYRNNPVGEPNTMANDLDMGTYNILNGGSIAVDTLILDGQGITVGDSLVATPPASSITYDNTTSGLGATTAQQGIDELDDDLDSVITLTGVARDSEDLGTFTGTTISDNVTIKVAFQEVETALDEVIANQDDLVTLTGVAENSTDLGTFAGSTISDNTDIKTALQELETQVEVTTTVPSNNYRGGLKLSNNGADAAHDIDITAGTWADSTNTFLLTSAAATTEIDGAVGTVNGGFPSALTLTANTWYHVFIVSQANGVATRFGFDTDLTASNLRTDWAATEGQPYTLYKRIGSVLTDGSSDILGFSQIGESFKWLAPIADYDYNSDGNISNAVGGTTVNLSVPTGVRVISRILAKKNGNNNNTGIFLYSTEDDEPTVAAPAAGTSLHQLGSGSAEDFALSQEMQVFTDSSSNIKAKSNSTGGELVVYTLGWSDNYDE